MARVLVSLLVVVAAMVATTAAGTVRRNARQPRQISLHSIMNLLLRSSSSDAVPLDTADLGRLAGYQVEEHTVVTEDGYILTVHRIPPFANPTRRGRSIRLSRSDPYSNFTAETTTVAAEETEEVVEPEGSHGEGLRNGQPKVVFLQHGLMGSSDNWNTNTEENSLAYLLSNAGYDVWMGNFRGNIYSRRHVNLTHKDPQFWRFSYDEMAQYDLPAMLEYVLGKTGVEKMVYVGHSMGTTVFFAMMSTQPEYYQSKISAMVALAPVATVTSIASPIKYLAPLVNDLHYLLQFFGNDQEVLTNRLVISLWDPYRVCSGYMLCENIQFLITGFDPSRADETMVPVILTHNPAGSSTQTLFHFAQGYTSGRFQQFDRGLSKNLLHYGQAQPPEYDVSKIEVPVTLFWAENDWLTGEEDINNLKEKLPHLEASHKVPNPVFSHLDFLWATDARSLVYDKVFDVLEEAFQKYF